MNETDQFKKLPKEIRNWLASENLAYAISGITDRIGLSEKKTAAVSRLIYLLITRQLDPKDFINELSHSLDTSFETAKAIAGDIEKNALHPMSAQLRRDLNLDVKSIYFGQPGPKQYPAPSSAGESIPQQEPPTIIEKSQKKPGAQDQGPIVDLQSFRIKSDKPLSPLTFTSGVSVQAAPAMKASASNQVAPSASPVNPSTSSGKEPESPPTPFMLHQENPTTAPSINPQKQAPQTSKSSLTMKVQNFYQTQASTSPSSGKTAPKPISIKFETSTPESTDQKISPNLLPVASDPSARVVHYSNLRTPLTTIGTPKKSIEKDNVLDLRKIIK